MGVRTPSPPRRPLQPRRRPHSDPRRTHRPIPSHSFRQSFEAKSAHAQQAFFQEFEVRPAAPCSAGGPQGPWAGPALKAWGALPTRGGGGRFDEQACPVSQELKEVGKEQPRLEAEHPANASKNRYPHVLPCERAAASRAGGRLGAAMRAGPECSPPQMTTPGSGWRSCRETPTLTMSTPTSSP